MKRSILSIVIGSMFLQACVSTDTQDSVKNHVNFADSKVRVEMKKAAPAFDPELTRKETEVNTPFLFAKAVPIAKEVNLPKALQKPVKTTLLFSDKESENWISLSMFAERVTRATGIFVTISPDVYLTDADSSTNNRTNDVKPNGLVIVPSISTGAPPKTNDEPVVEQRIGKGANGRAESAYAFYFPKTEGQLSTILDAITNKLRIHHKYDESTNTIHLYRLVSKNWQTKFSSTSYTFNNGQRGQTVQSTDSKTLTGNSQGSKSPIETTLKDNIELLSMRDAIIQTILTKQGKIFANPSTGTISMTDTEESIKAADHLITSEVKNLNRGVMLRVRTIQVTRKDNDAASFDIEGILNKALNSAPNLSFNTISPGSLVGTNAGSFGVGIFSGSASNSQAIVSALKEIGDVQVSSEIPYFTKNRKGIVHEVYDISSYVPNTTPAAATTGGTGGNIGLNTAQIQTGLKLIMLPTLGDDDSASVSFSMEESTKPTLEKFSVGIGATAQAVEKPNYTFQGNSQDIPIRSGQSLLLVGFERVSEQLNKRTMGENIPILAGGSVSVSRNRVLTLIQLSMQVIDSN
ncbi:hypothetical protein [Undibacterium sp.]|uniref:hypothetical protein n=1 Tax=Undibacterium sp. TaxID=1914977 RepID=UPI00374FF8AB